MALDYSLKLKANLEPTGIIDLLDRKFGYERVRSSDVNALKGEAQFVSVIDLSDPDYDYLGEAFGFQPTLSIGYTVYTHKGDTNAGIDAMVQSILLILEQEPGEAVLLGYGEITIMQRRAGLLMLDVEWRGINDRIVEFAKGPYEWRRLESPLL